MGAFSIWHLLIVLVIVILLFGTKRLRNIGADMGNAIKSFRTAVKDESKDEDGKPAEQPAQSAGAQNPPPAGRPGRRSAGARHRRRGDPRAAEVLIEPARGDRRRGVRACPPAAGPACFRP